MMTWKTHAKIVVGVAGLLAAALMPIARADQPDANKSPAVCGPGDVAEPGIQGDVPKGTTPDWNCGITAVGFLPGQSGPLTRAGDCAYMGGTLGGGVSVIDVSDPSAPEVVKVLPTSSRENLAAVVTEDRAILATRHRDTVAQQGQVVGRDMLVDIWNVRNCRDPQLLGTLRFPTNNNVMGDFLQAGEIMGPVHNVMLNPSGTKVYGTEPFQEGDISNLDDPTTWKVRDLECAVAAQHHTVYEGNESVCETQHDNYVYERQVAQDHELAFNDAGNRIYMGGIMPYPPGGDELLVVDMEESKPKVVGMAKETPGHSIDMAHAGGKPFLLSSAEVATPASTCVPDEYKTSRWLGFGDSVWLTDVSDETNPKYITRLELAVNKVENCTNQSNASTHYHTVDDPSDTTFAMISWTSAGLRVWDVRDPAHPSEVAYFNHGSGATDPVYDSATHQIWYSGGGGFWVLQLEPHILSQLGLD
jgi:hypothetical protein